MWFMHDIGGWWMWFGGIGMFIFWGGVIALVVWLIVRLTGRDKVTNNNTAIDLARKRYAEGEITREEFEQIKKDLS